MLRFSIYHKVESPKVMFDMMEFDRIDLVVIELFISPTYTQMHPQLHYLQNISIQQRDKSMKVDKLREE